MLILPSASGILFRAISPGTTASGTKLDTAYLEFVNGDPITPPDIYPADSLAYYDQLATTSDRDYLRVPILSHTVKQGTDGQSILSLIIVSDGETGVHGKPFSASSRSRIYGLALLASQSNERTDMLFARHYYGPNEQLEKCADAGVMLSFDLFFS